MMRLKIEQPNGTTGNDLQVKNIFGSSLVGMYVGTFATLNVLCVTLFRIKGFMLDEMT